MPSAEQVSALVSAVRDGRYVEAIEAFYHPAATMQENQEPPRVGRDALVAHEQALLARLQSMETRDVGAVVIDGDQVVINWVFEFTTREGSVRRMDELALQTWRDGLIVAERFFYDSAQRTTEVARRGAEARQPA
jgi:ketosteroid isomerase-like protein